MPPRHPIFSVRKCWVSINYGLASARGSKAGAPAFVKGQASRALSILGLPMSTALVMPLSKKIPIQKSQRFWVKKPVIKTSGKLKDINDVLTTNVREFLINSNEAICMIDRHRADLVRSFESQNAAEQFDANFDAKLKKRLVENELKDIPGVTTLMIFVLGEHGIRSIEDLADCATDDLDGWDEIKDGKTIRHAGILDRYRVSRQDCETMIINARIKAGWFK